MTESEIAEIKHEIVSLETKYDRAMRECRYLEGQVFRLKQKLIVISPEDREESLRVCRSIGSNLKDYKEVGE